MALAWPPVVGCLVCQTTSPDARRGLRPLQATPELAAAVAGAQRLFDKLPVSRMRTQSRHKHRALLGSAWARAGGMRCRWGGAAASPEEPGRRLESSAPCCAW